MTVRANRAEAERELAAMVAAVRAEREAGVRSTVGELLEAWYAIASTGWAPTTIRQTRSVLDRYLHPHLGDLTVGEITPSRIDAVYATLSTLRRSATSAAVGGNDRSRSRRAAFCIRSGDALGVDVGQPGRTRPSNHRHQCRASSPDSARTVPPARPCQ